PVFFALDFFCGYAEFTNGSVQTRDRPGDSALALLELCENLPSHGRTRIGHQLSEPRVFCRLRLLLQPGLILVLRFPAFWKPRRVLSCRGNQRLTEAMEFHQRALSVRELIQARRDWGFFFLIRIMIAVKGYRQMS